MVNKTALLKCYSCDPFSRIRYSDSVTLCQAKFNKKKCPNECDRKDEIWTQFRQNFLLH